MRHRVMLGAFALATLLPAVNAWAHPVQHGPQDGHLIGAGEYGDLHLLSSLELTDVPDLIADVGVDPRGTHAYLANWGRPDCAANSEAGGRNNPDAGIYVVDIRDLEDPQQVAFIPHSQDSRPGEGVQAVEITTRHFTGTMLVTNNEHCGKNGKGGVSLFNVTNPARPQVLSQNFGDRVRSDTNDIHSAYAWDAGDNAYVVTVDNFDADDVDILDITNPRRPRVIAELNLNDPAFTDGGVAQPELGLTTVNSFIHDVTVKKIGADWIMLVSYWDGGFVELNVNNPASPVFLGDTEYAAIDPELQESTGAMLTPEGNGHEAEYTADNNLFIGTDEDFAPFRGDDFTIVTGPNAGEFPSVIVPGAEAPVVLDDRTLNGPVVYGGYGCPTSAPIPAPTPAYLASLEAGEEAIVVLQRGPVGDPEAPEEACFPGEKAHQAVLAGWEAVLFVNHHSGELAAATPPFCGSGAFVDQIVGVCTTHEAFHHLFGKTPDLSLPYVAANEPVVGQVGEEIEVGSLFDGWGYVHLYDADTLAEVDTFAIPEAHMEEYAVGFGDLTVHEVATHPTDAGRAYLSYYSGGMLTLDVHCTNPDDTSTCDMTETGGFLAADPDGAAGPLPGGNDFWGVEVFLRDNRTIVLGSDRDHGLWIFEDHHHVHDHGD